MKIYTQPTKNDSTAWAPIRLGGRITFGARYRPSYPLEIFLSEALNTTAVQYLFKCLEKRSLQLIKFFTPCHYKMKAKLPQKILAFLEKIKDLSFFRFNDYGPFERGPGKNISNAFPFNMTLPGSSYCFWKLNTWC